MCLGGLEMGGGGGNLVEGEEVMGVALGGGGVGEEEVVGGCLMEIRGGWGERECRLGSGGGGKGCRRDREGLGGEEEEGIEDGVGLRNGGGGFV